MTDISKLGEFGLIDRLTKDIKPKNDSTIYGVGDDCAVLNYPDTRVLTTTDMLMEGVHFDLTYITMQIRKDSRSGGTDFTDRLAYIFRYFLYYAGYGYENFHKQSGYDCCRK